MSPAGARRPSLRVERALQRDGHRVLAGMDEVGRGALAGPVTVGVVVIDETCRSAPQGVKDSKLLAPHARERMVPRIERWALAHAVGHASADEIDEVGIIAALRLAGCRALAVAATGIRPDLVILDGNHDWLTSPEDVGLLAFAHEDRVDTPPVTTMIKADLKCSSVAAASVLAKVHPRPDHGRPRRAGAVRRLRLGREQGVCRARAPRRAAPPRRRASCTAARGGCPARWTTMTRRCPAGRGVDAAPGPVGHRRPVPDRPTGTSDLTRVGER